MPVPALFLKPKTHTVVLYLAAVLYCYLFATLLFTPAKFLADVGVNADEAACYLGQRVSVLMLGFAFLAYQAARSASVEARQMAAATVCLNMACFAGLSFWACARGLANGAYLPPAIIETVLAALCALVWLGGLRGNDGARPR